MLHNYLKGTPFVIEQKEEMYHMNSDSDLLGHFFKLSNQDRVLDVGCNQGVLMLYAAMHKPKEIIGIDLFEDVIALAKHNLARNQIEGDRYVSRIQDFDSEPFDVIICNPPYFQGEMKSENPYIKAARHQEYLPLDELFFHVARLLKEEGRFYMVYRPAFLNISLQHATKNNLYLKSFQNVFDAKTNKARTILLEFSKHPNQETNILSPIFL